MSEPEPPITPPAVSARLSALLVLVWLAVGVWGYLLVLGDDVRGVIVPVVQLALGLTLFGLRVEPSLTRWRGLLTAQAGAVAVIVACRRSAC